MDTKTLNPAAAVLWASAIIVAALIIIQAGKLPENAAHAQMVTGKSDYILLTTKSGRGDNDVLYIMDGREQVLLVYEVEDARRGQIILRDGGRLDNLFRSARR
jgi:hypothetical protein